MTDPQPTPTVTVGDAPEGSRFEARVGDEIAGFARYVRMPDRVVFVHTEVSPAFEGRGVGSALARTALDAMRERGARIEARCPFIAAYLKRHPEDADLVVDAGAPS